MMFAILRSAVCDNLLTNDEKALYNTDMLSEMINVSKHHDIVNILALGLKKNSLSEDDSEILETELLKSVYRYTKLDYELNILCNALETAQIPFMPLKGAVIRKIYPEPWLRTSCDIDVLIHNYDINKAQRHLLEKLKYRYDCENKHDIAFYTVGGCHIELHFDLIEDNRVNSVAKVLENVWSTAQRHTRFNYWYEMSDEMFYFYHIAHMAKHFKIGGCGIRPFIDTFILNNNITYDKNRRDLLLTNGGLKDFSNAVELLSNVWFNNAEHTEITLQMQDYILRGGVYGSHENGVMVKQREFGGKLGYALYKIFIPYEELKDIYPILKSHKYLTPIMEIRRWCRLIFCGQIKRATNELKYNNSISKEKSDQVKSLLDSIGL